MVGGKPEVFARVKPVLEAMGSSVVLCGEVGAGNVTKLGKRAGVDPEAIYHAIR